MSCQHGVCPNLRAPSLLALNSVQHDKRSCFPVSFLLGRGYFLPPFPQLLPPLSLHLPDCRVRCALPTFTATHIVRVCCLMVLSVQWSGLWEATNISWHSFESDCKVTESDSNNSTIIYSLDPCLLSPLFLDALSVRLYELCVGWLCVVDQNHVPFHPTSPMPMPTSGAPSTVGLVPTRSWHWLTIFVLETLMSWIWNIRI